jgi:FkbM family methyltransferase
MRRVLSAAGRRLGRPLGWRDGDRPAAAAGPRGDLPGFLAALAGRGFAPRHVLDVGAHRGDWCRAAYDAFPGARFTLVEPQTDLGPDLERFCAQTPGARSIAAGAAAAPGTAPLTGFADRGASSFLPGEAPAGGVEVRRVPVITLDSLLDGPDAPPVPELVKIDVEGWELEVLAGAGRLLGATELFVLETALFEFRPGQPTLAEVVAFMARHGYLPYDLVWTYRRPLDGALALADVAFARRDGALRADNRWE